MALKHATIITTNISWAVIRSCDTLHLLDTAALTLSDMWALLYWSSLDKREGFWHTNVVWAALIFCSFYNIDI